MKLRLWQRYHFEEIIPSIFLPFSTATRQRRTESDSLIVDRILQGTQPCVYKEIDYKDVFFFLFSKNCTFMREPKMLNTFLSVHHVYGLRGIWHVQIVCEIKG